jgi:hypothetical protein
MNCPCPQWFEMLSIVRSGFVLFFRLVPLIRFHITSRHILLYLSVNGKVWSENFCLKKADFLVP